MNTTPQSPGSNAQNGKPAAPEDHLGTLQADAQAALASAREHGTAQFEQYRDTAAQQIETLAQSAQSAAEQLQEDDTFGLSHYVTDIAQNMTTLAGNLRGKSVDELIQQASRLARDNPALFLTGSVALGFGLSRFLRASSTSQASQATGETDSGTSSTPPTPADNYATQPGAAQDVPASPPHTNDIRHGGQPGIPDAPLAQGSGASAMQHDPLGADATYPDSHSDDRQPGSVGQTTDNITGRPEDRHSKGDVS